MRLQICSMHAYAGRVGGAPLPNLQPPTGAKGGHGPAMPMGWSLLSSASLAPLHGPRGLGLKSTFLGKWEWKKGARAKAPLMSSLIP